MKKAGKTTRPFRYDLNQTTYDYTVEVMNRFKGLDMVNREPEELWTEICDIILKAVTKIKLIIFFAAKDGEALHSQQKQDLELTVA